MNNTMEIIIIICETINCRFMCEKLLLITREAINQPLKYVYLPLCLSFKKNVNYLKKLFKKLYK